MTTSRNIFARLRELVPEAPLLVGLVIEHHDDDTSSVRLPIGLGTQVASGSVATGSVIRPRGRTVPVGSWAFVRRGLIESEAPGGAPVQVVVGRITEPVPEPEPEPPAGVAPVDWPVAAFGYAEGAYVATADGRAEAIVSADHISYVIKTLPSSGAWSVLAFGGGVWVTAIVAELGETSTAGARSTDGGQSWQAVTLPAKRWQQAAYGAGGFVLIAEDGTLWRSTDGQAWSLVATLPQIGLSYAGGLARGRSIAFGAGGFLAVGGPSSNSLRSVDGLTWTSTTVTAYGYGNAQVAYADSGGGWMAYDETLLTGALGAWSTTGSGSWNPADPAAASQGPDIEPKSGGNGYIFDGSAATRNFGKAYRGGLLYNYTAPVLPHDTLPAWGDDELLLMPRLLNGSAPQRIASSALVLTPYDA